MKDLRRAEIKDGLKTVVWNPTGGMDAVQTRKKPKGDMAEQLKEQVRMYQRVLMNGTYLFSFELFCALPAFPFNLPCWVRNGCCWKVKP